MYFKFQNVPNEDEPVFKHNQNCIGIEKVRDFADVASNEICCDDKNCNRAETNVFTVAKQQNYS